MQPLLQGARAGVDDLQLDASWRACRSRAISSTRWVGAIVHMMPSLRTVFLSLMKSSARRLASEPALADLLEVGLHHAAELGQVRVGALAMEQRAAELLLEQLDGPGERGLRDVAALGGAR